MTGIASNNPTQTVEVTAARRRLRPRTTASRTPEATFE